MEIIQSILMGIVQGLSEFLPISSSGHLVFTSALYNYFTGDVAEIETGEEIFASMMFHIGTLIAVLIFFKKDILNILKAMISAIKTKSLEDNNAKMGVYIIIGTIFTILVAFPLHDVAEHLMYSPQIVGLLLIGTGLYLFLSEKFKTQKEHTVSLKNAIFMGIAQGIAAFPGFSRSGLTIATGLFRGIDRVTCARFSFLLSFPIILGASVVYPLTDLEFEDIILYNWTGIIAGTIASGVVGYYCIKYFLKFVARFSLNFFAYYCIILGTIFAILFSFIQID